MKRQALLPLITYPNPNAGPVAVNAVAMAVQLAADLHVLALNVNIPPVPSALLRVLLKVPELIHEAEAISRRHGHELTSAAKCEAEKAGVGVTVSDLALAPAMLADTAATHARYFDFALVGWEKENSTSHATAEALVFGSGRPVILLPETSAIAGIDHIAVAWDGSRVAARAVADATSLLERAEQISVITVVDEKPLREDHPGERLANAFRKRGLKAESVAARAEGRAVGIALQEHAIELGADLLTMGGYGHSRVRDFILGGATQDVLRELRLPVLLSN